VLVEGPGPGVSFYGGKYAGPIAAQLILKAKELGYLGGPGNQSSQPSTPGKKKSHPKR
jgi:hypothetical protein